MSENAAAQKKATSFKEFRSQVRSGAIADNVAGLDLDIEDADEQKNNDQSLDAFLGIDKDGPGKRLEDDVSEDSSMDYKVREIITTNKKLNSDELFAVNEALYKWLVKRAEKVIRRKGRGYDRLTDLYIKKCKQDPEYLRVTQFKVLGEQGRLSDVNAATADTSWRASVRLHGPAFRRRREKWLKNRPPKRVLKVSAEEEHRVVEEKKDIEEWNRFLKNEKLIKRGLPPEYPETMAERRAREVEDWEASQARHRELGNYKEIRPAIDPLEIKASMVDWDYGIYRIWDILKNPVPGVGDRPETEKPRRGVIKIESDYEKHALVNLHSGSIFHKSEGDVGRSYQNHYFDRKLAAAELYVLEEKIRIAQEALEKEKQRTRIMEDMKEGGMADFFEHKKLTNKQKQLREQLFKKAVDRQMWRGKGSSKEVARQIYQDLKRLEREQGGIYNDEEPLGLEEAMIAEKEARQGCFGFLPSCLSLHLGYENRLIGVRKRWWKTKGTIKANNFKKELKKKKAKKRKRRKQNIHPTSELIGIRDHTAKGDIASVTGSIENVDICDPSPDDNNYHQNTTKNNEQESLSSIDKINSDVCALQPLGGGDGSVVTIAAPHDCVDLDQVREDITNDKNQYSAVNEELNKDISDLTLHNETGKNSDPQGDVIVTATTTAEVSDKLNVTTSALPSRIARLTQTAFSPLKIIGLQRGNMDKRVKASSKDEAELQYPSASRKASLLPPIASTPDTSVEAAPEGNIDEVRLKAKEAMAAQNTTALSRAERTNKKLSKDEAVELIQELARKRGERQLKSVLGRQKGLSHAVQLAAKEGSTEEVPTGIIVDVEEGRALRLEKMRRKQVFALDKKHVTNQPKTDEIEHVEEKNDDNDNEDEDKPENAINGGLDNELELDENITGKKSASFFEQWKSYKKNKYKKKSKYSSASRKEFSAQFEKEASDRLSATRPSWMNTERDKKLLSAIIKSHHQYIQARDEQELRCLECFCCCTCCCCVHIDDIEGRYIDLKFTIADLMQAVNDHDIYQMLDLIYHPNYPVSVNDVDINGETPLYRIMTDTMQNVYDNIEDDDGEALIFKPSPFWVPRQLKNKATKMRGKKEWVIKVLLYAGADINFISHTKAFEVGSLLHFAVEKNLFAYAEWLVDNRKCEVITYTTMLNRTPLMLACLKGHSDLVMYLLQRGSISVLNHKDNRGWSALHFAAGFCDHITVKALLVAGADKYARNNAGRVPVDEGLSRGKHDNVDVILTHNAFDPIKETIDRLDHLKKYHADDIDAAVTDARYRKSTNTTH